MSPHPEQDHIEAQPMKIGMLLVNEGFVHQSDVETALEIQRREAEATRQPLGKYLVKEGLITTEQLQTLLAHPELREGIGPFAVARGLMDKAQLETFIRRTGKDTPLDDILLEQGGISPGDVREFLAQQLDSMKLGELALRLEMVPEAALKKAVRAKRYPRTIGQILCDLNLITPIDLSTILTKYRKHLKLGQILLKQGVIDEHTLDMAMLEQESKAEPLGNILLQTGMISEETLYEALAQQHNIPFETCDPYSVTPEKQATLTSFIGKTFARQFRVLPVDVDATHLTVAIPDPDLLKVVHSLRAKQIDLRVECTLVTMGTYDRLFRQLYEEAPSDEQPVVASPSPTPVAPPKTKPAPVQGEGPQSPTAASPTADEMIRFILKQALQSGAETIHMDRSPTGATLKFRIQGKLMSEPPPWFEKRFREIADEVLHRIKEIAGLRSGDPPRPGEGGLQMVFEDPDSGESIPVTFSVAACPSLAGENITMALLDPGHLPPTSPAPPLSDEVLTDFSQMLEKCSGLLLVVGPGESYLLNTARAALSHINRPEMKIVTVENPIRGRLPGIVQTQANTAEGLTGDILFRMVLKLDPDAVMLDRLKEPGLARQAFETALTGPMLLSTLRANDAVHAITRLRAIGIPPYLLGDALNGILALQPVPKLCERCKSPYPPEESEWAPFFQTKPEGQVYYKGKGCRACNHTGYHDRVFLAELLPVTGAIMDAISAGVSETELRRIAMGQGIRTLVDDGLSLLDQTTLPALSQYIPQEAIAAFKEKTLGAAQTFMHTEVIARPAEERAAVDRLHQAYERQRVACGRPSHPPAPDMFMTFIHNHFHRICQQHQCTHVLFSVQEQDGQATIMAMPVQAAKSTNALK